MGVEVAPQDGFKAIGEAKALIEHHGDKYGWEVPGKNNEEPRQGWNEGPCMLKHEGVTICNMRLQVLSIVFMAMEFMSVTVLWDHLNIWRIIRFPLNREVS